MHSNAWRMLDFDTYIFVLVSDRFVRELGSVYLWMLTMLYMTKYQPALTAPTWTDREHIFAIKTTTNINYAINYAIVTTRKESPFEYSMSWSCTSSMSMRWFNCLLCFTLCFEQNCISASRLNCYETTREYISHYYIPPSICINIRIFCRQTSIPDMIKPKLLFYASCMGCPFNCLWMTLLNFTTVIYSGEKMKSWWYIFISYNQLVWMLSDRI